MPDSNDVVAYTDHGAGARILVQFWMWLVGAAHIINAVHCQESRVSPASVVSYSFFRDDCLLHNQFEEDTGSTTIGSLLGVRGESSLIQCLNSNGVSSADLLTSNGTISSGLQQRLATHGFSLEFWLQPQRFLTDELVVLAVQPDPATGESAPRAACGYSMRVCDHSSDFYSSFDLN